MSQPRPVNHLNTAMSLYPRIPNWVDSFRSSRGKDLPQWPDWCFMPMAAWYAVVCDGNGVDVLNEQLSNDIARLSAIGTWRYSKGVYRLDPDLMDALTDSPVSGSLPSEVLYRLPEWSIYVETPGQTWFGDTLYGFWAHLEWDANTGRSELRFLFDCQSHLLALPLHIGPWTIIEAVDRAMEEAYRQAQMRGIDFTVSTDEVQEAAAQINPLVSVLLYLCSEEPEIDDNLQPGVSPSRPAPKKTKKGWRLFAPPKPRVWSVGTNLGEQLREAAALQELGEPTGRTVKAHLRRGHWHGFWLGPRAGERKFVYRWLSPLVVGVHKPDSE